MMGGRQVFGSFKKQRSNNLSDRESETGLLKIVHNTTRKTKTMPGMGTDSKIAAWAGATPVWRCFLRPNLAAPDGLALGSLRPTVRFSNRALAR